MPNAKKITVKLVKSPIGYNKNQSLVVQSLGLGKLNSTKEHYDTPTIRGMINKIPHLVSVVEEK
ncbi:MAG: 50S ribosomal protein L30 [Candidatus Sericytochromatia bacterium]